MILTVNKNENNSLSFSKSDRHTFRYKMYVNVSFKFSNLCSRFGAASAFSSSIYVLVLLRLLPTFMRWAPVPRDSIKQRGVIIDVVTKEKGGKERRTRRKVDIEVRA